MENLLEIDKFERNEFREVKKMSSIFYRLSCKVLNKNKWFQKIPFNSLNQISCALKSYTVIYKFLIQTTMNFNQNIISYTCYCEVCYNMSIKWGENQRSRKFAEYFAGWLIECGMIRIFEGFDL